MKRNLLFIGPLDFPNTPQAGDSVKNRYLLSFFEKCFSRVDYVDTQSWKRRPRVLLKLCWFLLTRRYGNIVISTYYASAYRLIRLFDFLHIRGKKYYFMIGAYTPVKIAEGNYRAEPFRKLERIVVEADKVAERYHSLGIDNTFRLYNFKPVFFVPDISARAPHSPVRFVFLSRLTRQKGIFLALEAARTLQARGFMGMFTIDFYGRLDAEIQGQFMEECSCLPDVCYKGFLKLDGREGYELLSGYDALLFPTLYVTEGFPGVVADAAIAALPVIASDWDYAEEVVGDGRCGRLFPMGSLEALTDIMQEVIENPAMLQPMREHALLRTRLYDMNVVLSDELIGQLGMSEVPRE